MSARVNKYMFKHLQETNMGYFAHMFHSFGYAKEFFIASIKAVIHGIYPDIFKTTSTDLVNKLK